MAGGHAAQAQDNVFELGKLDADITVIGEAYDSDLTDNTVTIDDVWKFNRNTLDEAVKLIPGVTSTLDGTARRNERGIYVRGFGRWQVPLSIDGIRIYLPADNRLDFNRFLTQDLAEIDVQKGYVSVLDGPGGMGGAINLVTRKPTETFESEIRLGSGDGERDAYASLGTRHDGFYVQGSVSYLERDYWELSDDFVPTAMEDGGRRNGSDNEDSRFNLKVGFTPNDTDEYSISYTAQAGEKGAPLTRLQRSAESTEQLLALAVVGHRQPVLAIDDAARWRRRAHAEDAAVLQHVRELAVRVRRRNLHDAVAERALPELLRRRGLRGQRRDRHAPGRAQHVRRGVPLSARRAHRVQRQPADSAATNHRARAEDGRGDVVDRHREHVRRDRQARPRRGLEPRRERPEAGAGVQRHRRPCSSIRRAAATPTNLQGAAYWEYTTDRQLRGVISSRTRFPTIFERFSTRFGTAIPNPNLEPERAVNYELGWSAQLSDDLDLTTALFYADVEDMIQTVIVVPNPQQTQTQNVGDGEFYGVELGVRTQLSEQFGIAANYTHLEREINDPLQPNFEVVGAPDDSAFVAFTYQPTSKLTITPSIELASDRWSEVGTAFIRTGDYSLLNLQVQYRGGDTWEIAAGGSNLTDENFELAFGYPEVGRNVYVRLRLNF